MSNIISGLKRIGSGIVTMLSPVTAKIQKHKEGNLGKGLCQIKEGVKHIFGKTKEQILDKRIIGLLSDVPQKDKIVFNALLRNQHTQLEHSYQDVSAKANKFVTLELTKKILEKSKASNLVGIQPLQGPVGLAYSLERKQGEGVNFVMEVTKHTVCAGTRRLQTVHNPEAIHDLACLHDIDVKEEFESILATEISSEMDYEIISDLTRSASEFETDTNALDLQIIQAANQVKITSRTAGASWAVLSEKAALELSKSSDFKLIDAEHYAGGLRKIGSLRDIQIYFTANISKDVLVGCKVSDIDTGYIYCPYVPLLSSGVVIDANTFAPRVSLMVRYGKYISPDAGKFYTAFDLPK